MDDEGWRLEPKGSRIIGLNNAFVLWPTRVLLIKDPFLSFFKNISIFLLAQSNLVFVAFYFIFLKRAS